MTSHPVTVIYDISDNSDRAELVRLVTYYGLHRVQYSVFMGFLSEPEYVRMREEIRKRWQDMDVRIVAFRICECCLREMLEIGCEVPRGEDEFLVL